MPLSSTAGRGFAIRRTTLLHGPIILAIFASCLLTFAASAGAAGSGTIAFNRAETKDGRITGSRIWLMRGDGARERPIPRASASGSAVKAAGLTGIPPSRGSNSAFDWLAGGGKLAFVALPRAITISRTGRRRISTLDVDVGHRNRVGRIAWAPDGRRIAFDYFSRSVDTTRIFVHPFGSGAERQLPLGEAEVLTSPAWSPQGMTIAATGALPTVIVHPGPQYEVVPPTVGVWLLDPAGGEPRRLATWPRDEGQLPGVLDWSPDGTKLVVPYFVDADGPTQGGFFDDRDNRAQLLVIDAQTGAVRELLSDIEGRTRYHGVAWSPNGRHIAYVRTHGAGLRTDVWVVNAQTGKPTNLTRTPKATMNESDYTWSPDSRHIALARRQGIWTISLGGKAKRLSRGLDSYPTWTAR